MDMDRSCGTERDSPCGIKCGAVTTSDLYIVIVVCATKSIEKVIPKPEVTLLKAARPPLDTVYGTFPCCDMIHICDAMLIILPHPTCT